MHNGSEITGRRRNKKTLQTPKKGLQRCFLASPPGFEPGASGLGGLRSIQLSYGDKYSIIIPQLEEKIKLNLQAKWCML